MTMREVEDALGNIDARLDSFNPLINAIVGELDKLYGKKPRKIYFKNTFKLIHTVE